MSGTRLRFSHRASFWLIAPLALVAGCATAVDRSGGNGASGSSSLDGVELRQPLVPLGADGVTQLAAVQARDAATMPKPASLIVPPSARKAVVDARDAMQKKQWSALGNMVVPAQPDPLLGDYPAYWWLRQQLHDSTRPIPQQPLRQFLENSRNLHLVDRLRGDWIVATVRAGDFAGALQIPPVTNSNASVDCSLLLAKHMVGQPVTADQAIAAFSPNRACWSMLDQLAQSHVVDWNDLSFELRAILETSKTGNAQRMAAIMFDGAQMQQYAALMKNPRQWLDKQATPAGRAQTELVTLALSRLARSKDRREAAKYIDGRWASAIPAANMEWVWSQFGLIAALNVELDAAEWYRRSGEQRLTDYNHAWEVRAELRRSPIDWARVQQTVDRMTRRQASEPVWVYWKARALDAQDHQQQARQLYASIASELNFYGQLANEELGHTPFVPALPKPVTTYELQQAQANSGLQRAIQLFDLGWRPEAVMEWNFALRGLNDRDLLAAAELARREQIYDRVVNTSLQTRDHIDFTQRFIAPFEGRVTAKAREINLDPSWVYGLIRQESRFITDARSRVGASGLMQLMPATAKWVAKKIGMTNFKPDSVNDFDTNTILGTSYLRMVLDQLDGSEILATAGYNAGPGRPILWRSKLAGTVEGAVFAETIPFTETRLYVKNVMSNAVYYAMMFSGQPQSIKERLGTVAPKPSTKVALP